MQRKISDFWLRIAAGEAVPSIADEPISITQLELSQWANMDEPERIRAEQRHYGKVYPPVRSTDPNQPGGLRSKG